MSQPFVFRLVVVLCWSSSVFVTSAAQSGAPGSGNRLPFDARSSAQAFPADDAKRAAQGFSWLYPVWHSGQVDFTDGLTVPLPGERIYLNFDKATNRLYCKSGDSMVEIKRSGIRRFHLNDSLGMHSFVRLPELSPDKFFEELSDSGKGFVLYRERSSRPASPEYISTEYVSTWQSSNRHPDDVLYYLFYPDRKRYFRFRLTRPGLRKKLARLSPAAEKFMQEHDGRITIWMMLRICDVLNELPAS